MSDVVVSETVLINDCNLCIHRWPVLSSSSSSSTAAEDAKPRALVVICHGFLAHGRYPTVRYAAECLQKANYAVVSGDLRGHGRSDGLPGYLEGGPDGVLRDAVGIAEHAISLYPDVPKIFLVGSSMGGAIALQVAQELQNKNVSQELSKQKTVAGVVLLAPMLKLSVHPMASSFLEVLATIIPTWQVIPSSTNSAEQQYRDPVKRKECEEDKFAVGGSSIRVASASTCVQLASRVQDRFPEVSIPLLILVADEDILVNNQGALDLMEQAASTDKTIKHYPALHGLLCEPPPLLDEIQSDILNWMDVRS